jgi:hypothetical protein
VREQSEVAGSDRAPSRHDRRDVAVDERDQEVEHRGRNPAPPSAIALARASIAARTVARGNGSPTPIARPTTNCVWNAVISSAQADT